MSGKRIVKVVRKKAPVVDRGPKEPQKQKVVRYFDPSAPLMYAEYPQKKKVSLGKAPKCMVVGFPEALTVDQANLRLKSKKVPATSGTTSERTSRLSSSFARRSPLGDAQNDGQGNGGNLNQNQNPNQNFHFFDQESYAFVSSDASVSTVSMPPQRIQAVKKEKKKTSQQNTRNLMTELFNKNELADFKYLKEALNGLRKDKKEFITNAGNREQMQKQNWIQAILEMLESHPRRIGDLFEKIFQGIATGKDDVYFLYDCTEEGELVYGYSKQLNRSICIERRLVKPLLKGEDVHRYN